MASPRKRRARKAARAKGAQTAQTTTAAAQNEAQQQNNDEIEQNLINEAALVADSMLGDSDEVPHIEKAQEEVELARTAKSTTSKKTPNKKKRNRKGTINLFGGNDD